MHDPAVNILYVEDDETLGCITMDNLTREGYNVVLARDGMQALELFGSQAFDICIVDVMLPLLDGFSVVKEMRATNLSIPVIFLTAKTMKDDKLHGLRLGADDYISKPFSIEELVLKIEIFIRRCRGVTLPAPASLSYQIGSFTFIPAELVLIRGAARDELTLKESQLLEYLCKNKNQVLKRDDILRQVWGQDDYFLGRSMDVFISRLRKIFQPDPSVSIENIHKVGFKLKA